MSLASKAASLLEEADIRINGSRPWDIQVHDDRLYGRVMRGGSLALGESYMDGWWDAPALDQFFDYLLASSIDLKHRPFLANVAADVSSRIFNFQSRARAFMVGQKHYDIGNDLYARMLDSGMVYTCGYWKDAATLDQAQEAKLDLTCRKVRLEPGMRVLDIGCGWGSFAKFAAARYDVDVVGLTISVEQAKLAQERCRGLPVEIRVQDYREIDEPFDAVVSLGMFEHVGYKNYRTYMEVARRCLESDGLFLLHTIGNNRSVTHTDPWLDRYIFPNGMAPSLAQIMAAAEGIFEATENVHNFGPYYDRTLMAWNDNFQRAWPELRDVREEGSDEPKYSERFKRMWEYYLLSCAGSFRARRSQLYQIVFSPFGVPGGYQPIY